MKSLADAVEKRVAREAQLESDPDSTSYAVVAESPVFHPPDLVSAASPADDEEHAVAESPVTQPDEAISAANVEDDFDDDYIRRRRRRVRRRLRPRRHRRKLSYSAPTSSSDAALPLRRYTFAWVMEEDLIIRGSVHSIVSAFDVDVRSDFIGAWDAAAAYTNEWRGRRGTSLAVVPANGGLRRFSAQLLSALSTVISKGAFLEGENFAPSLCHRWIKWCEIRNANATSADAEPLSAHFGWSDVSHEDGLSPNMWRELLLLEPSAAMSARVAKKSAMVARRAEQRSAQPRAATVGTNTKLVVRKEQSATEARRTLVNPRLLARAEGGDDDANVDGVETGVPVFDAKALLHAHHSKHIAGYTPFVQHHHDAHAAFWARNIPHEEDAWWGSDHSEGRQQQQIHRRRRMEVITTRRRARLRGGTVDDGIGAEMDLAIKRACGAGGEWTASKAHECQRLLAVASGGEKILPAARLEEKPAFTLSEMARRAAGLQVEAEDDEILFVPRPDDEIGSPDERERNHVISALSRGGDALPVATLQGYSTEKLNELMDLRQTVSATLTSVVGVGGRASKQSGLEVEFPERTTSDALMHGGVCTVEANVVYNAVRTRRVQWFAVLYSPTLVQFAHPLSPSPSPSYIALLFSGFKP